MRVMRRRVDCRDVVVPCRLFVEMWRPSTRNPPLLPRHDLIMDSTRERRTTRLLLRPVEPSDRDALTSIHIDPRTNAHTPDGPPDRDATEAMLASFVAAWEGDGHCYWAVELEGTIVGVAGVEVRTILGRECWNLYYRFDPDSWGRGFATEVAREGVAVAGCVEPTLPIVARTRPANEAAIRVAERAGLARRPDLDHDGFVVLAANW
jgi:ribosomal-protein-alanine N-acetyltransferase